MSERLEDMILKVLLTGDPGNALDEQTNPDIVGLAS